MWGLCVSHLLSNNKNIIPSLLILAHFTWRQFNESCKLKMVSESPPQWGKDVFGEIDPLKSIQLLVLIVLQIVSHFNVAGLTVKFLVCEDADMVEKWMVAWNTSGGLACLQKLFDLGYEFLRNEGFRGKTGDLLNFLCHEVINEHGDFEIHQWNIILCNSHLFL